MNKDDKSISWVVVIIALIVFWPIGLVAAIYKIYKDRSAIFLITKVLYGIGIVFLLIALLGFCSTLGNASSEDIGMIFFFSISGGILAFYARSISKTQNTYKRYISIIVNQGIRDINQIANIVKKDKANVKKELEVMIKKNYFEGAYIDDNKEELFMHNYNKEGATDNISTNGLKNIVVACKNCGAETTIKEETVGTCEFCGSAIQK